MWLPRVLLQEGMLGRSWDRGTTLGTRVSEQGLPRSSGKAKSCFSCVSRPRDKENALVIILALGKVLLKDVKCQTGGLAVS